MKANTMITICSIVAILIMGYFGFKNVERCEQKGGFWENGHCRSKSLLVQ